MIGARPQFVKAAPVSRALRETGHEEFVVHTGQHYDYRMSGIFFEEMGLPDPNLNLGVGSGSHAEQTGQMLLGLEEVMVDQRPDWVLVYGDTNSTLAGALAASKLRLPVAHVEAGLRSFNREMPEEINRVLTDHCSDLLFCPTQTAVDNLAREGITRAVHLVGDTMHDAVLLFTEGAASRRATVLDDLGLEPGGYLLATLHRPYNTDKPDNLLRILDAFAALGETVVLPAHPRLRRRLAEEGCVPAEGERGGVMLIEPLGYLDMLALERHARLILTDSGGIQKEAYFFGVPCVTLRPETEWVETVESGWNVVVGADPVRIVAAVKEREWPREPPPLFGDGRAAYRVVAQLSEEAGGR